MGRFYRSLFKNKKHKEVERLFYIGSSLEDLIIIFKRREDVYGEINENQISEVKKGKNTLETNNLDFHKMLFQYKKVLKKNASNNPYSTVTDFAKFLG